MKHKTIGLVGFLKLILLLFQLFLRLSDAVSLMGCPGDAHIINLMTNIQPPAPGGSVAQYNVLQENGALPILNEILNVMKFFFTGTSCARLMLPKYKSANK